MGAPDLLNLLIEQLTDVDVSWRVGTFGAIAEFARDAGEPAQFDCNAKTAWVVTPRGAIRVEAHEHLRPIASESLTSQSWNQRVALCLPETKCAMNRRPVLSELGPDQDALRPEDRSAVLFDLGLGTLQLDACIRTSDAAVITELRRWTGQPAFAPGSGAMAAILAANPHRVFVSPAGRVEVYQPIPPPDGKSPDGPHTHILPRLLRHNRTHAATEPLPPAWIPCAHFYPPHPTRTPLGEQAPLLGFRHTSFQQLLDRFGDPVLVDIKRRVAAAVSAGQLPSSFDMPDERSARAAVRVALRQQAAVEPGSPGLAAWLATHDRFEAGELNDASGEHPCTA